VVPSYEPWQYYATLVLNEVSKVWGGAGFILIPHDNGKVATHFLRLANAYDPDHVVAVEYSGTELMKINPERYRIETDEGKVLTSDEITADSGLKNCALSLFDGIAVEAVADACDPFHSFYDENEPGDLDHHLLSEFPPVQDASNTPATSVTVQLSARDSLTSDLAAMRASKFGETSGFDLEPGSLDLQGTEGIDVAKASLDLKESAGARRILEWASDGHWEESRKDLTSVMKVQGRYTYFLVVGDGGSDFYLAHALDRLSGSAVWVPEHWLSAQSKYQPLVAQLLSALFRHQRSTSSKVQVVTSTGAISNIVSQLKTLRYVVMDPVNDGAWIQGLPVEEMEFANIRFTTLTLKEGFDDDDVLPATRLPSGTLEFVNRIPAWLPKTKEVLEDRSRNWVLDIDVLTSDMVRGHGLHGHFLEIRDNSVWERLRSGRDGVALASDTMGWALIQHTRRQRLARPRLRVPSLFDWVKHKAEVQGWKVNISDAGQKAASAARMWGRREALADDLKLLEPFFRAFLLKKNGLKSCEAYPDKDGIALGSDGFLTFRAALRTLKSKGFDEQTVRIALDRLLGMGVLRRGLALKCLECGKFQWFNLSELTLNGTCQRCDSPIPIALPNWKSPVAEPNWYYDLHPIVRQLLTSNGDIPILAGRVLQKGATVGEAIPELEFKKDGAVIEIDLIFGDKGRLVVGECKKHPNITKKELKKKIGDLVIVADLLQADLLLLAAGDSQEWTDGDRRAVELRLDGANKTTGRIAKVQLLSGLRNPLTTGVVDDFAI
jgi:hypothetical protein